MPDLALVRRLEAVSFRSWPAGSTYYDGAWAIRLTGGHPAKRLNSVNALDPGDQKDLELRIERAAERFGACGRPLIFRQTPLAPPALDHLLDQRGWRRFDETIVMRADLAAMDLSNGGGQAPLTDCEHWLDQCIVLNAYDPALKPGLRGVIKAIEAPMGLFLKEAADGTPQSAALCVHDGDLAGLFEVVSNPAHRTQGHGRAIVESALRWAQGRFAQTAWLQVTSANEAAIALYQSLGFAEVYRYAYREARQNGES